MVDSPQQPPEVASNLDPFELRLSFFVAVIRYFDKSNSRGKGFNGSQFEGVDSLISQGLESVVNVTFTIGK